MNLYETVEPSLLKLKRRLKKDGIHEIDSMDYVKYLRSVFWKEIKEWVLERDNFKCVVCAAEKRKFYELEVHHRSYDQDVLEGKNDEMLASLCPRCHKLIEFNPDKSKRKCLQEKDAKFLEIKRLHAEIENNGLPLRISEHASRGGVSYKIVYAGTNDYSLFYSIDILLFMFVIDFCHKYKGKLKIPLPFGRSKLHQKVGARILDKATGKQIVNIKMVDGKAVIKATKFCTYPILKDLTDYISEQKPWCIAQ